MQGTEVLLYTIYTVSGKSDII